MRVIKLNFVIALALLSPLLYVRPAEPQTGNVSDKIEGKVLADLRRARTVTFFVVLGEQADLRQAAAVKGWRDRGEAVVSSLRETAGRTQAPLLDFLARFNAEVTPFWIVNTIKVTTSDEQLIHRLAALPSVAQIKADKIWQLPEPAQGAQEPTIQSVEWGVSRVHAPDVWSQFGALGQGIVVASIDTGVQFNHPALVMQYRGRNQDGTFDHNYNWYDPSRICGNPSLAPCDNNGHGTHTMGTAVGGDGGSNQIGVAPGARWITAKGCENNTCSSSALLASGQWILAPTDLNGQNPRPDLRPNIVNNSWSSDSGSDSFYRATVQAWVNAGIFPAFAIGNSGSSCSTAEAPGTYPESVGAGAIDIFDNIAAFSSRGPASGFGGIVKPNVSAPGVNVRSSVPTNSYASFSGTSMATPHVSGVVALLWSANPALIGNITATTDLLQHNADFRSSTQCGSAGPPNNVYGWGIINALTAVQNSLPIRTLTVASASPSSGVSILVSPNDNNGQGNGVTQFTRTYNSNTVVTITASATAGGNNFSNWSGCDNSSGPTCTVTMNANKAVLATYAAPIRTLTVASSNPNSGVGITVSPNDKSGFANGSTQFTRTYDNNTVVTLTAPSAVTGNNFQKWQRDGVDWSTSATTQITIDADRTMTAVYVPSPASLSLSFDGMIRDKVGQNEFALNPDGQLDGVFTVTLNTGSGNRTVTRMQLNRAGPVGVWDTQGGDGFWSLGAANGLDTTLLNAANDSVNFAVAEGSSFKVFAADYQGQMFVPGSGFTVTANFSDGSTATASTTIVTLPTVTIAATTPNAAEGGASGVFTVSRTGATTTSLTVNYTVSGTATNGTDYSLLPGSVSIPVGSSTAVITVAPIDDSLVEGNETVVLTLSANASYTVGSPNSDLITITDNDGSPTNPTITLGYDGMLRDKVGQGEFALNPDGQLDGVFTVTLNAGSGNRTVSRLQLNRAGPVGIWDTQGGDGFWSLGAASGLDTALLNAANDSVNFVVLDGSSFKIFAADYLGQMFVPGSGFTVTANFSDGSTATASTTIVALPTVTIAATTPNAAEGGASGVFTVTRTGATTSSLTVNYTVNGTGTNGQDYQTLSGNVTILSGQSSAAITVIPIDDSTAESAETVIVTLSSNANYTVGSPNSATVTIQDNDGGPTTPTISLSFDGMIRDRVGQNEFALNPDGQLDGVFTVTLNTGSGNRTVTRMQLNRAGPVGVWDTQGGDGFWSLGAASGLDTTLLNAGNDSVNFAVAEGSSFKIFAADYLGQMFVPGSGFTVNVNFADGSTAIQNLTLP